MVHKGALSWESDLRAHVLTDGHCALLCWGVVLGLKERPARGSKWVCFPGPISMSEGPCGLERFLGSSVVCLVGGISFESQSAQGPGSV